MTKLFATGIKLIDLLAPLAQAARRRCSGAPVLQDGAGDGADQRMVESYSGISVFAGVGERPARGTKCCSRCESGVRTGRAVLQPDERAARRPLARAVSALTIAESFATRAAATCCC